MPEQTTAQTVSGIHHAVDREFAHVAGHLRRFDLLSPDWRNATLLDAARPGVYVWVDTATATVVRVGLSLVNARARALQHIRDDTGGKVKALDPTLRLLLFTFDADATHWAAALEIHLEQALGPDIPSLR